MIQNLLSLPTAYCYCLLFFYLLITRLDGFQTERLGNLLFDGLLAGDFSGSAWPKCIDKRLYSPC